MILVSLPKKESYNIGSWILKKESHNIGFWRKRVIILASGVIMSALEKETDP